VAHLLLPLPLLQRRQRRRQRRQLLAHFYC
jgi:hypothetical protein